jgi:hypothetical protein
MTHSPEKGDSTPFRGVTSRRTVLGAGRPLCYHDQQVAKGTRSLERSIVKAVAAISTTGEIRLSEPDLISQVVDQANRGRLRPAVINSGLDLCHAARRCSVR